MIVKSINIIQILVMPTDKQSGDLEKTADAKKEEEVKEANVDDICIGDLDIGGKCELDTNEVRYLIFFVSA